MIPPVPPPPLDARPHSISAMYARELRKCADGPRRAFVTRGWKATATLWRFPSAHSLICNHLTREQYEHWAALQPCAYCGAQPGESCVTTSRCGCVPSLSPHSLRLRAARRALDAIDDDTLRCEVPSWLFWCHIAIGCDDDAVALWARLAGVQYVEVDAPSTCRCRACLCRCGCRS